MASRSLSIKAKSVRAWLACRRMRWVSGSSGMPDTLPDLGYRVVSDGRGKPIFRIGAKTMLDGTLAREAARERARQRVLAEMARDLRDRDEA
jgi:hypothetical protein